MKNQCFNPYLPSWEYIPDGEPYVFGGRVYVFGSHDIAHGWVFCQNDYVCWSAPVDDLSNWRYEGVIYEKTGDPENRDGRMCLYAPDVTIGQDGRYYLYYVLDKISVVSVAVCDSPAGKYEFYGYVKYPDGTRLGEREGDEPQFDPGVLTEGDVTYLYTGFCMKEDMSRSGAMAAILESDMLTIKEPPVFIVPSYKNGKGTSFEGHEYFEAASIRKLGETYYFIYSAISMNELCYATSKYPTKDFKFGGAIVSNCDLNISTYKPAEKQAYPPGNNHGSIVEINNRWYVFYHRFTNGTWFSRHGLAEPIEIKPDGSIPQAEMTSQGLNGKPLIGKGEYPAYIACNLWNDNEYLSAKITQDGRDGDNGNEKDTSYIANITDGTTIGFKYFDFKDVQKIAIIVRGYGEGVFEIRTSPDGEILGEISVENTNIWTDFSAPAKIPDGINALYFTFKGTNSPSLRSFALL